MYSLNEVLYVVISIAVSFNFFLKFILDSVAKSISELTRIIYPHIIYYRERYFCHSIYIVLYENIRNIFLIRSLLRFLQLKFYKSNIEMISITWSIAILTFLFSVPHFNKAIYRVLVPDLTELKKKHTPDNYVILDIPRFTVD